MERGKKMREKGEKKDGTVEGGKGETVVRGRDLPDRWSHRRGPDLARIIPPARFR